MTEQRTAAGVDTRTRIDAYLTSSGLAARRPRVVPLTGDASDRRYFRILIDSGESVVLALHTGAIELATLPFANVALLLGRVGVPAPAILGHSDALGIIELEDLGDVTLQAHVGAASVTEHAALYREAVALIARLQQRGREFVSTEYMPYGLAFDVEKLTWELDFFARHFLEGYRGITLTGIEREALAGEWRVMASELSAEPRVVCHRDYHSRNLMLHRGSLYMIDFQDARLGPDTYDLVSLLRDSYVDITDRERDELIAYFLALIGVPEGADYARRFDVMSVQRNLKALGTFGFQAAARGNPVYIQYMARTLHYVRANLDKHDRFARLRELLGAHLAEVR